MLPTIMPEASYIFIDAIEFIADCGDNAVALLSA